MDKNDPFSGAESVIIEETKAFIEGQASRYKEISRVYLHSEIVLTSVSQVGDLKTPKMLKQLVSSLGSFFNRKTEYLVPRNWEEYGEFLFKG